MKIFSLLLKIGVLGGLFHYYFLNFSKEKKIPFGVCSKVAIFLMRSIRWPPT